MGSGTWREPRSKTTPSMSAGSQVGDLEIPSTSTLFHRLDLTKSSWKTEEVMSVTDCAACFLSALPFHTEASDTSLCAVLDTVGYSSAEALV